MSEKNDRNELRPVVIASLIGRATNLPFRRCLAWQLYHHHHSQAISDANATTRSRTGAAVRSEMTGGEETMTAEGARLSIVTTTHARHPVGNQPLRSRNPRSNHDRLIVSCRTERFFRPMRTELKASFYIHSSHHFR